MCCAALGSADTGHPERRFVVAAAAGRSVSPPLDARLRAMAEQMHGGLTLSLGEVEQAHGAGAQGALLVLLAAPCLLPLPGTGTVLSVGLCAMAWLMWRGQTQVALPERVAQLRLSATSARRLLGLLAWLYSWAGRLARVRWANLTGENHRHWMAATVLAMAVLIFLPIPMGNVLPATALLLLGLGLVFKDGVAVALAMAVAVLAVAGTTALLAWTWHMGVAWV